MNLPTDGLIAVVKRDCPTCALVAPVLADLARDAGPLTVHCQDDPGFPQQLPGVVDDGALEASWRLKIDTVPTLIRVRDGREQGRAIGWHRGEWQVRRGALPATHRTAEPVGQHSESP